MKPGRQPCLIAFKDASLFRDYTIFLWLLKIDALVNLYCLVKTYLIASDKLDSRIIVSADVFFAVSGFRCLFPVRYEHSVVFHNSVLSSFFLTRLAATFSEIAYIFYFLMFCVYSTSTMCEGWTSFPG